MMEAVNMAVSHEGATKLTIMVQCRGSRKSQTAMRCALRNFFRSVVYIYAGELDNQTGMC